LLDLLGSSKTTWSAKIHKSYPSLSLTVPAKQLPWIGDNSTIF
jgi:hypothetical protein